MSSWLHLPQNSIRWPSPFFNMNSCRLLYHSKSKFQRRWDWPADQHCRLWWVEQWSLRWSSAYFQLRTPAIFSVRNKVESFRNRNLLVMPGYSTHCYRFENSAPHHFDLGLATTSKKNSSFQCSPLRWTDFGGTVWYLNDHATVLDRWQFTTLPLHYDGQISRFWHDYLPTKFCVDRPVETGSTYRLSKIRQVTGCATPYLLLRKKMKHTWRSNC